MRAVGQFVVAHVNNVNVRPTDCLGTLSVSGVIYGVVASLCVALNAIFTKRTLPSVGDNIWRLTMYNNLNAVIVFLPLMLMFGELPVISSYGDLMTISFWIPMNLSGFLGFGMSYVTGLQIQVLTHV